MPWDELVASRPLLGLRLGALLPLRAAPSSFSSLSGRGRAAARWVAVASSIVGAAVEAAAARLVLGRVLRSLSSLGGREYGVDQAEVVPVEGRLVVGV